MGVPVLLYQPKKFQDFGRSEIGRELLISNQCDAVLVGAVDLHCDERNLSTLMAELPFSSKAAIRPFDIAADGTLPGEGAVAVVLKRLADAQAQNNRIFAVIGAIGSSGRGKAHATVDDNVLAYQRSLNQALDDCHFSGRDIGLMETHGSGIPQQDDAEAKALNMVFGSRAQDSVRSIAIGALKPLVGHTGAVSGLASAVKTALCLHHQVFQPCQILSPPGVMRGKTVRFSFPINRLIGQKTVSMGLGWLVRRP